MTMNNLFNFSELRAYPMPGTVLSACKVKIKKDMVTAFKEAESKTMCRRWEERASQVGGVTCEKNCRRAIDHVPSQGKWI